MARASLYRFGGYSLVIAALLWAIGQAIIPRGPVMNIAQVAPKIGVAWIVGGTFGLIACALCITFIVAFYRHFVGAEGEGWAALSVGVGAVGAVVSGTGNALAILAQPILLQVANSSPPVAAFDPVQAGLASTFLSAQLAGGTLMWLSLLPIGMAMLRDTAWSRAVTWGAFAAGVVLSVGPFLVLSQYTLVRLLEILGMVYLALLGNAFARIPRASRTREPEPTAAIAG